VVSIHSPLTGAQGWLRAKLFFKRNILRLAHVVACSPIIAAQLGRGTLFIPNPYRAGLFRRLGEGPRPCELVFLGRLVSDKGIGVLIQALAVLRERGLRPRLLIIGSGPEEAALRAQGAAARVSEQVEFAGRLPNEEVVSRLNQCRIMVVPSVWEEPFPVVPLEGIACGCVVVASQAGGLPEGVGPCGLTFPKGDAVALADRIAELLQDEAKIRAMLDHAAQHLARHQPGAVATAYLAVIERAFHARSSSLH
jgi:glycosyltransferase involved in cell wall biosynthesis